MSAGLWNASPNESFDLFLIISLKKDCGITTPIIVSKRVSVTIQRIYDPPGGRYSPHPGFYERVVMFSDTFTAAGMSVDGLRLYNAPRKDINDRSTSDLIEVNGYPHSTVQLFEYSPFLEVIVSQVSVICKNQERVTYGIEKKHADASKDLRKKIDSLKQELDAKKAQLDAMEAKHNAALNEAFDDANNKVKSLIEKMN